MALLSLISGILLTIANPAFKKAFNKAGEKVSSTWNAQEDLEQLRTSIQRIEAVVGDAVAREGTLAVKKWIEDTKDVLYKADDLFDAVATDAALHKQREKAGIGAKVKDSLSKLNPAKSNDLAEKVKAIRENLKQISVDMATFNFSTSENAGSVSSTRRGRETPEYVNSNEVVGRSDEHEQIINLLLDGTNEEPSVIAIVGTGGIGKSTLAQLVCTDERIQRSFRKKWWACISKPSSYPEIVGKIFQSMTDRSDLAYHEVPLGKMISGIREALRTEPISTDEENEKFLLVIDDLWEDCRAEADKLRFLLSSKDARGSKILVTTRNPLVADAMGAPDKNKRCCQIKGLSPEASWALFESLAFRPEQKKNKEFIELGESIITKCENVPLAIKSIASLLYNKPSTDEWRIIEQKELPRIEFTHLPIMPVLRLSYDQLEPHLKQCFAYCSLFPKGHVLCREELIYLWVAQGYVKQETGASIEASGNICFLDLLRRSFFQEVERDERLDEIVTCKMNSLMHDLAQHVAIEECIVLTNTPAQRDSHTHKFRHLSVVYQIPDSWSIPQELLACSSGLRSFLFKHAGSLNSKDLQRLLEELKVSRALNLGNQKIDKISNRVSELKHLRYLNLSNNTFTALPDCMTKLVNLHALDISFCKKLRDLPEDFGKLINLRHLDNRECYMLSHMPQRFGELTSLQHLSYFKVRNATSSGKCSMLDDAFAKLKLTGELMIRFDGEIQDWNGDECWRLPSTIQALVIYNYPDMKLPHWGPVMPNSTSSLSKLVKLKVTKSSVIQCLPSFSYLRALKVLELEDLEQLEYVETADSTGSQSSVAISPVISLPCLEELTLCELPKLERWSETFFPDHQMPSFPACLSSLKIYHCQALMSMPSIPSSPCIQTLQLDMVHEVLMERLLESTVTLSTLKTAVIWGCEGLKKFPGEALVSLRFLELKYCNNLEHLFLAQSPLDALEELVVQNCAKLVLWGEESKVGWDLLPKLRVLTLDEIPNDERLPGCLLALQSAGSLQIKTQM